LDPTAKVSAAADATTWICASAQGPGCGGGAGLGGGVGLGLAAGVVAGSAVPVVPVESPAEPAGGD